MKAGVCPEKLVRDHKVTSPKTVIIFFQVYELTFCTHFSSYIARAILISSLHWGTLVQQVPCYKNALLFLFLGLYVPQVVYIVTRGKQKARRGKQDGITSDIQLLSLSKMLLITLRHSLIIQQSANCDIRQSFSPGEAEQTACTVHGMYP